MTIPHTILLGRMILAVDSIDDMCMRSGGTSYRQVHLMPRTCTRPGQKIKGTMLGKHPVATENSGYYVVINAQVRMRMRMCGQPCTWNALGNTWFGGTQVAYGLELEAGRRCWDTVVLCRTGRSTVLVGSFLVGVAAVEKQVVQRHQEAPEYPQHDRAEDGLTTPAAKHGKRIGGGERVAPKSEPC